MPPRNPRHALTRAVFQGHDDGHYRLPADLLAYRDAVTRLRAALAKAHEEQMAADPGGVRTRLGLDLPVLARAGDLPAGWVDALAKAQAEQTRASTEAAVIDEAIGRAESMLTRVTEEYADTILTESLRPVLADIVAKVRKATTGVVVPWDQPSKLARATAAVRTAWATVEEANVAYEAIRKTQRQLQLLTEDAEPDAYGRFHEVRNLPALWPNMAWQVAGNTPPWPSNPLARLVWVCTPPVEVWMPTGTEVMGEWIASQRKGANQPRVATLPGY
jgi:hypothetical protein